MRKNRENGYPFGILPYFAFLYMCSATYTTYFSNYLVTCGVDKGEIGTIMAVAPIIALLAQPVWGLAGDRMKWKNNLLSLLTGASAVVLLASGFVNSTLYAYAVVCAYSFFQSSVTPLLDTISLEVLEKRKFSFGPVRMIGTVSYALTAPIVGWAMADNYRLAPFIASAFMGMGLIAAAAIPKVPGHQHGKQKKVSMVKLLSNRPLMIMLAFTVVITLGMSYYNTYFSLYLQEIGGSSAMLGLSYFLSAGAEVPFLLIGDRIFRKMGVGRLLMLSAGAMTVRMLLIGVSTNLTFVLLTQVLHGMGYIVISFAMAKFINLVVPKELKASGQMLLNVVGFGFARAIGSWFSGLMVAHMDMRTPFWISALICLAALIVFGWIIMKNPELRNAGRDVHAAEC